MRTDLLELMRSGVYIDGNTLSFILVIMLLILGLLLGALVSKGVDKIDGRQD